MQTILPPSGNTIKILGKPKLAEHGLRWMTYVLAQPVEGGVLVFHTLTRALLLLTPEEYAAPDNLPELRSSWFRVPQEIQETDGALRVFLQERLESLVIVRTFAKEEQMTRQADALMDAHKAARMKRSNFSNLCNIGFAGAMDGAYLLGIGFCGYGILTGTMSYGNLMAIMQLVGQVQSPFANLTGYLPRYYSMLASAERLMEAEAFAPDSTETVPEEQTLNFYQTELQSLQLEHICFTYQPPVQTEGEPPAMPVVLQDVSLTVRKGEYVVFTGPSGCGKSTLLKLLMCLYPLDSGLRFLSTKTGNQPLTPAWKSLFAYVPQGNQLLSGSIRSIVAFGDEDRAQDENAIYNALKIACADDFVRRLENGLDTVLGERGAGLSEGQMQRIAIARAVYNSKAFWHNISLQPALNKHPSRKSHRLLPVLIYTSCDKLGLYTPPRFPKGTQGFFFYVTALSKFS